jgi:hypothetical protein
LVEVPLEHVADALESRRGPTVDLRHHPIIADTGIGVPGIPSRRRSRHFLREADCPRTDTSPVSG